MKFLKQSTEYVSVTRLFIVLLRRGIVFIDNLKQFKLQIKRIFISEGTCEASTIDGSKQFEDNKTLFKILGYSNKVVKDWNNYIKNLLFPNIQKHIVIGLMLTCYKSMENLQNSSDYEVIEVENIVSKYSIEVYRCKLENLDTGDEIKNVDFVVPSEENNKLLTKALETKMWKSFYGFKNCHLLIEDLFIPKKKRDKEDDNRVKKDFDIIKKDFDYGYALTVHKSQGMILIKIRKSMNEIK